MSDGGPGSSSSGELKPPDDGEISSDAVVERVLRAVREHLDLDVAFVGQVTGGERVFRYVDTRPGCEVVAVGDRDPVEDSYCYHVLTGRLPQLLPDAMQHPVAAALPVTQALPVGSHVSVPIRFSDGRTYGTFCCFSLDVKQSLDPHDLRAMQMMADLAGQYLEAIDANEAERRRRRRLIETVIGDAGGMSMVFQPLRDLGTMKVAALEALARFPGHDHGPEWFFSESATAGLGVELEMQAVRLTLDLFEQIPDAVRLNINVSPETLYREAFFDAISGVPGDRLVVEVTEHAAIDDYTELKEASGRLAAAGVWLAIDDVGMGFSGLNRILETSPHELKLDAAVIREIEGSPAKQALVEAICGFSRRTGLIVVAEGIESAAELATLRSLGVHIGQGYLLGRPVALHSVGTGGPGQP